MPKKGNRLHSATDLHIKTELPNIKGVRFLCFTPFGVQLGYFLKTF